MFLLKRWFSVATAVQCVNALRGHGLENEQVFAPDDFASWRLYVRLWAELGQTPESAPKLSFLNRYWVMAATYDGLAFALIIWAGVLVACIIQRSVSYVIGIPLSIVLVIFASCPTAN
jgi:hypothetical protein